MTLKQKYPHLPTYSLKFNGKPVFCYAAASIDTKTMKIALYFFSGEKKEFVADSISFCSDLPPKTFLIKNGDDEWLMEKCSNAHG